MKQVRDLTSNSYLERYVYINIDKIVAFSEGMVFCITQFLFYEYALWLSAGLISVL
jgi:hypothetical protein